MAQVLGLGGVFFKSNDPKGLGEWYRRWLGVPVDQITLGSRFVQDLHAESIQSIELVAGFEAEFDIEMDEDEALEVKNVGDAVTFIAKYVDEK